MLNINKSIMPLLGYAIILNEEMHSRQIKLLEKVIKDNNYEEYREDIYNVINDKEEKITIEQVEDAFANATEEERKKIFLYCYQLILVGHEHFEEEEINSSEKEFLNNLESKMSSDSSRDKKSKKNELKKLRKTIFSVKTKNNFSSSFNIDLKGVNTVAKEDFEHMRTVIKNLVSVCDALNRKLSYLPYDVHNQKLLKAMQEFQSQYEEKVLDAVKKMKENIPKKELASENFSIALMGRTKAGKSTLHSIMCQEGEEFIGTGSQRTTRFNRVFSWNGLKIIDTPGIGAGEEDGQKDTEIAERVISQADIICFVVVDDTISSEDILATLDRIAEYHKPMIVLLNHKDNINRNSHLKKFIENPTEWMNTKKEKNLSGWIERLKRNAEKNGYQDMMSVVPVFLLAASKGLAENNPVFYESSNYPKFIDEIKKRILQNCIIYKSQTMLDEPSVQLHKIIEEFEHEIKILTIFSEKIEKIKKSTMKKFESIQADTKDRIKKCIEGQFESFSSEQRSNFVDSCKERDSNGIASYCARLFAKFERDNGNLQSEISKFINEYHRKINEEVKKTEEEFRYANLNISGIMISSQCNNKYNLNSTVPVKGIFMVTSNLLFIASEIASIFSGPLAIVITTATGIVTNIIGGFFKSKKQKEAENKKQLENIFKDFVEKNKKRIEEYVEKEIEKSISKDKETLNTIFNALLEQTKKSLDRIELCRREFEDSLKEIDTYYAIRILEFITENASAYRFSKENVKPYRNPDRNLFEIKTKLGETFNVFKIQKITKEKILVQKYK